MKKVSLLLLSILFVSFGFGQEIVCAWTFDDLTGNNSGASNTAKVIASNPAWGAGTLYADGTNGSDDLNNGPSPEINAFNGSTLNDPRDEAVATKDLAIVNTTANGKGVVFKFSTTGYQNLMLSYAQRGTATGFSSETWSYSTDGVNFTELQTLTGTNVTTYTLREVSLSSVVALNDAAVVYIRLSVDGCTSGSGNNRIDNVVFRANMSGPDVYAPVITSHSVESATTMKLNFNEGLDAATAQNTANYQIDNGAGISAATLSGNQVTLTFSPALSEGTAYTLVVNNVADVTGNVMSPDTLAFTYGVSEEFQVANIAALRAKWTDALDINGTHFGNDVYKLTGNVIVTGINDSYRHQIFIQDATGAIVIDDPNGKITTSLETGDEITGLYGTLTDYYGLLQFAVTEDYNAPALSIYNDVAPLTVTLAELQNVEYMNAHQCELIRMETAKINPLTSNMFENGKKYTLTQNGQTGNGLWIHFYNIEGLTGEQIPSQPTNLTGVNKISYGEYYLIPRTGFDLGTDVPNYLNENDLDVYPNPAADRLTVSLRTDQFQVTQMAVYDLNGRLVLSQPVSDNQLTLNVGQLSSGSYFLRLSDGKFSVTTKFVKK